MALDEAVECLANSRPLPDYPMAITFDDGYGNFYDYAYPIIKKYVVPSTIFLVSDFIEKKAPLWTDRLEYAVNMSQDPRLKMDKEKITADIALRNYLKTLPEQEKEEKLKQIEKESGNFLRDFSSERQVYAPLKSEQISEMGNNGVKFGCHTKSHPILTNVPIETAETEIRDSKNALCGKIRNLSNIFSYPNGQKKDFNETIENIAKKEGFRAALTTIPGFNNQSAFDLYALKRFSMDKTENFSEFLATISGVKLSFQRIKNYAKRS